MTRQVTDSPRLEEARRHREAARESPYRHATLWPRAFGRRAMACPYDDFFTPSCALSQVLSPARRALPGSSCQWAIIQANEIGKAPPRPNSIVA